MTRKPYTAKSLKGAEREVRRLRKQNAEQRVTLCRLYEERKLLARLAADEPQFYNPVDVVLAKSMRDRILGSLPR